MFEVDGAGCLGHRSASTARFHYRSVFSMFEVDGATDLHQRLGLIFGVVCSVSF